MNTVNSRQYIVDRKFIFGFLLATIYLLLATPALAQELEQGFIGPGGCTSKEECRRYCDEDSNKEECLTFAVNNGLMTQEEADRARKFLNQTGPGGCRGDECKAYCETPANRDGCIKFAEENGLISKEEASRFKKFKEIEEKGGPGGCKGENECRNHCEDEANHEECFAFAKQNDLLPPEEIEKFETGLKIKEKIKSGGGPGGCKSDKECHEYCSDSSHIEECVAFGSQSTGKSSDEIRRMIEEFKNNKDGFRGPEGFERNSEEFEKRRQEFESRREEFEGRFKSDFGDGEFEDGEFQKNFQMVPEEFRNERNPQRPPTAEELEKIKEKYRENYEKYKGVMPPERVMPEEMKRMMQKPEGERMPYDNFRPENQTQPSQYQNMMPKDGTIPQEGYPKPEDYQQYQQGEYQQPPTSGQSGGTYQSAPPPPSEPKPTSYDPSKSFLSNMAAAFMAPFRK
ncbi:MAG: hypothetical protein AAB758_03085 [Patescibacteria group bacterium]